MPNCVITGSHNTSTAVTAPEDRCELAKTAYQRLYLLEPDLTPDNVIIVGDTPNDILCAQAIKARSLIILAGSTYNTEELKSYTPWQIIPELPDDPRDFAAFEQR